MESAQVLVPALNGLEVTVCDEQTDSLRQWEKKFCFSPEIQTIYTVSGIGKFLEHASGESIYELREPLGTVLLVLKGESSWILLGPYAEHAWDQKKTRSLFEGLHIPEEMRLPYKGYYCQLPIVQRENAVNLALLLAKYLKNEIKNIETIQINRQDGFVSFSDAYANASMVNRRYRLEEEMVASIEQGEFEQAYRALKGMEKVMADIRFMSDSVRDQLVGAAILRTLIRIGAKRGGLSAVLVDSISQEYAQNMRYAVSKEELDKLTVQVMKEFCQEVKKRRLSEFSAAVCSAMDYMKVNLGKTMTTSEIASAAGQEKNSFVRQFHKETGMTVKEYLAKERCRAAAKLLADSNASVWEIASFVGYSDNNYFSKVFRTHMGMSPLEYRNSRKQ